MSALPVRKIANARRDNSVSTALVQWGIVTPMPTVQVASLAKRILVLPVLRILNVAQDKSVPMAFARQVTV